jgi:4-hydroxy-tetrahydrodipicolinate reductase
MKISLIGYGKMGKEIEKIAISRNHTIVNKFDIENINELTVENLKKSDIAIEFTTPETAFENYIKCFEANIPVVSGTTGWLNKYSEIKEIVESQNQTFLYSSNFSIGVNIFFKINSFLSKIMNNFPDYQVEIEETHHTEKKDAPSGTAITLAEEIIKNINKKTSWINELTDENDKISINSLRKVNIPGIHTIKYESPVDIIEITHSSKNRTGLATGAVLAGEYIFGKKGLFTMDDFIKL